MTDTIRLTASDGVTIGACRATPAGEPRGGIVVLQEIFGVNPHIRRVADGFAAQGYLAIAPALFDRVQPGVEIGYAPDDIAEGTRIVKQVDQTAALLDVQAAVTEASKGGKVGVVGFCWGGTLAFAAAADLSGLSAAVGYYGGGIAGMLGKAPKVPLLLHFGDLDQHISADDVRRVKAALPDVPVHTYHADHGFNCDARGSYDPPSAAQAMERSLQFFGEHLG